MQTNKTLIEEIQVVVNDIRENGLLDQNAIPGLAIVKNDNGNDYYKIETKKVATKGPNPLRRDYLIVTSIKAIDPDNLDVKTGLSKRSLECLEAFQNQQANILQLTLSQNHFVFYGQATKIDDIAIVCAKPKEIDEGYFYQTFTWPLSTYTSIKIIPAKYTEFITDWIFPFISMDNFNISYNKNLGKYPGVRISCERFSKLKVEIVINSLPDGKIQVEVEDCSYDFFDISEFTFVLHIPSLTSKPSKEDTKVLNFINDTIISSHPKDRPQDYYDNSLPRWWSLTQEFELGLESGPKMTYHVFNPLTNIQIIVLPKVIQDDGSIHYTIKTEELPYMHVALPVVKAGKIKIHDLNITVVANKEGEFRRGGVIYQIIKALVKDIDSQYSLVTMKHVYREQNIITSFEVVDHEVEVNRIKA